MNKEAKLIKLKLIDAKPNLPSKYDRVDTYLKLFKEEEEYEAYTLDDDFNIAKGIGTIESNGSYNYHNNYDDSQNCLHFKYGNGSKVQKFWTVSLKEIKEIQKAQIEELLNSITQELTLLKNTITK